MSKYLLIESRDPYTAREPEKNYQLAQDLCAEGNQVTLFLVENGVLPARRGAASERLSALVQAGVEVLADEFALRERGIDSGCMAQGIKPSPLEVVVDHLAAGSKTIWH